MLIKGDFKEVLRKLVMLFTSEEKESIPVNSYLINFISASVVISLFDKYTDKLKVYDINGIDPDKISNVEKVVVEIPNLYDKMVMVEIMPDKIAFYPQTEKGKIQELIHKIEESKVDAVS